MEDMSAFEAQFSSLNDEQKKLFLEFNTTRQEYFELNAKYNTLVRKWVENPTTENREAYEEYYKIFVKPRQDELAAIRAQAMRMVMRGGEFEAVKRDLLAGLQDKFGKPVLKRTINVLTDLTIDGITPNTLKSSGVKLAETLKSEVQGTIGLSFTTIKHSLNLHFLGLFFDHELADLEELQRLLKENGFDL